MPPRVSNVAFWRLSATSGAAIQDIGKMTLTKSQLAAMLLDQLGLNEHEAEGLVESFYEEISLALTAGESVNLAGFGNFEKDVFTPSVELTRAGK